MRNNPYLFEFKHFVLDLLIVNNSFLDYDVSSLQLYLANFLFVTQDVKRLCDTRLLL